MWPIQFSSRSRSRIPVSTLTLSSDGDARSIGYVLRRLSSRLLLPWSSFDPSLASRARELRERGGRRGVSRDGDGGGGGRGRPVAGGDPGEVPPLRDARREYLPPPTWFLIPPHPIGIAR